MKILERATSDWNPFSHFLIYARNARFEIFWTNCTYIHMCVCVYISNVSRAFRRDSRNSGRFVNRVRERR